jgi:hypothetical protein
VGFLLSFGECEDVGEELGDGSYLLGVIPLGGMALLELGLIGKKRDAAGKLALHATFVAIFLVVAHIAMIFGMLNPEMLGYSPTHMPTQNMEHMQM